MLHICNIVEGMLGIERERTRDKDRQAERENKRLKEIDRSRERDRQKQISEKNEKDYAKGIYRERKEGSLGERERQRENRIIYKYVSN